MKVLITAETVRSHERTGIQQYALQLARSLAEGSSDIDVTILISDAKLAADLPVNVHRLVHRNALTAGLIPWHSVPRDILEGFDVIHCTTVLTPFMRRPRTAVVMTIHDLVPLIMPARHDLRHRLYYRWALPHYIHLCDRVIAVSESTRSDMLRLLSVAPDRVQVVGQSSRWEALDWSEVHCEKDPYFLALGTLEPRKNLPRTIAAFVEFKRRNPTSVEQLFIAGRMGWGDVSIEPRDDIRWLGYINDRDVYDLLTKARALLYPSLYEGFGLPVLEAMGLGCPIICSDRSSLPEVAGDAAVYCDPESLESIATAIERVSVEDPLPMMQRGLTRARLFSWTSCATATKALYRSALEGRRLRFASRA